MPHRHVPAKQRAAESSARTRIVAEARRHFFAHGFRGVTMDDLARELAMSKKTLYDAFPLHHLLECVQGHMEEIQPPFVRDIRREAPDLFNVVENRRRDVIQRHFGKVFLEGRRAGLIRQDIPPKLAIEILLGAVQAIMNPPKMEELGLTPKSGFSAIIRVVLEGLTTEKARAR